MNQYRRHFPFSDRRTLSGGVGCPLAQRGG